MARQGSTRGFTRAGRSDCGSPSHQRRGAEDHLRFVALNDDRGVGTIEGVCLRGFVEFDRGETYPGSYIGFDRFPGQIRVQVSMSVASIEVSGCKLYDVGLLRANRDTNRTLNHAELFGCADIAHQRTHHATSPRGKAQKRCHVQPRNAASLRGSSADCGASRNRLTKIGVSAIEWGGRRLDPLQQYSATNISAPCVVSVGV
ncbi:Uncharacterised protein [Mycobacteroides abscessus subsp. massiliense]|nr:Uncharacterised protein [Mycobacteroides abscessus subsp. massiliense]